MLHKKINGILYTISFIILLNGLLRIYNNVRYFCNMIMFLFCQEVFYKYTKIPNISILGMCMYQFSLQWTIAVMD